MQTSFTRHPRHYTSDVICDSEEVGHCGGVEKLVLFQGERRITHMSIYNHAGVALYLHSVQLFMEQTLTGTFFCVTTTAQSFPLTATDVSPPWFMALNAYSARDEPES